MAVLAALPDSRAPADSFIDPRHDDALVADALARLMTFDFVAFTEAHDFQSRLQTWLGREVVIGRQNETSRMPAHLCSPIEQELTAEARQRLAHLSRLDLILWRKVVEMTSPGTDASALQDTTFQRNPARYAALMAG